MLFWKIICFLHYRIKISFHIFSISDNYKFLFTCFFNYGSRVKSMFQIVHFYSEWWIIRTTKYLSFRNRWENLCVCWHRLHRFAIVEMLTHTSLCTDINFTPSVLRKVVKHSRKREEKRIWENRCQKLKRKVSAVNL